MKIRDRVHHNNPALKPNYRNIRKENMQSSLTKILNRKVPYAFRSRTVAEAVAQQLILKGLRGNLRAIKLIIDAVGQDITRPCARLVRQRVPNDPEGRRFADLIIEAIHSRALRGDVRAFGWIVRLVEGPQ
jgi:hypothetical protein